MGTVTVIDAAGRRQTVEEAAFTNRLRAFESTVVDVGTGDGRFAYQTARSRPRDFVIGLDTAAENMAGHAKRAARKPQKGGLENVVYVAASITDVPSGLCGVASELYCICPWGILLEGLGKGTSEVIGGFASLARQEGATFRFYLTYDCLYEAAEIQRRQLPTLSIDYVQSSLVPIYATGGLYIREYCEVDNAALRQIPATWLKRLGHGRSRRVLVLSGEVIAHP
jgi:16S rRNA (adenine(1408)-N(1))-methyltransferase